MELFYVLWGLMVGGEFCCVYFECLVYFEDVVFVCVGDLVVDCFGELVRGEYVCV